MKIKNIVISGTNFWNPGDDFVRDGVIRVLKELFKGYTLNFLFYNFNADFFPQSKFEGTGNMIAAGDLDKYRGFVDAIVIAGLSAGNEIKDLYNWIITNRLENKVYLIGAGYENDYVDKHIYEEPEATIFKNARVITGRTEKTPAFIPKLGLPYHHISCPAILSVEDVKDVPADRKIEKIGFSIQIPHKIGIVNQATGEAMYQLATSMLVNLSSKYVVEVVAHHKTEYFHFLRLLKNHDIPVIFSSFYEDLFDIYPRYDLVISTRLHACIFANGFGIPAFIINETDRHTHTAEGFLHSICIDNISKFNEEFEKICRRNLRQIAQEAREFKDKLMQRYLNVLAEPFGVDTESLGSRSKATKQKKSQANCCSDAEDTKSTIHVPADYQFDSEINEQKLVRNTVKEGMTVFDVGAHLGKYTKLFSLLTGDKGRVYAFEPAAGSFKKLALSLKELNCTNVTLINKAIYSQNGKVVLHEFPEEFSAWNSLGWPKMQNPEDPTRLVPIEKSSEVDAVTLDSFCQKHNINKIDYLKLDIEGAELEALIGTSNLLENKAIRYLQFEISEKMLQGLNTKAKFIFDFLNSKGYECHCIAPDGHIGRISLESDSFYENYIAFPSKITADKDEITSKLFRAVCNDTNAKLRVLNTISQLTKDHWLERNIEMLKGAVGSNASWFDTLSFLNWYAANLKPSNYLEVGVRRGRSISQVLVQSPETKAYGFDLWAPEYAGVPNPGPDFVVSELKKLGVKKLPTLIAGNSHETLPRFWSDPHNPRQFELIFVDGDHTYEGAKKDLESCFAHLAPGGALLFDDIQHLSHPWLKDLWEEYKNKFADYIFIENLQGCGTGVAFKPPFTKLKMYLDIDKQKVKDNKPNVGGLAQEKVETFDQMASSLPIHFFTIVLNGQPFIRHHIEVFKKLPFKWHWHIIEGVAELKHDTAWSVKLGGRITEQLHRNGLSNDGTTEYIDELTKQFPGNITIYRKPGGAFWNGKLEMVNAPLSNINEECLLWQVDSDELWTAEQIRTGRDMFIAEPDRTAAYYLDHFFVGENLVTTTINTYGNNTSYEWLRTWRFNPGFRWATHEPPQLCKPCQDGRWMDVATIKPFKHNQTGAKGLIFQHYAYATKEQVEFKEVYYGYKNAIDQWRCLQQHNNFPVFLKDYFAWVNDNAQVDTVQSQNITPLGRKDADGRWWFAFSKLPTERHFAAAKSNDDDRIKSVLWVRTDSIGDSILSSSMLPYVRKRFDGARITVLCQEHVAEIYEFCPFIDEIITIPSEHKWQSQGQYESVIRTVQKTKPGILLNSTYSVHGLADIKGLEFIPKRLAFRHGTGVSYTDIIPTGKKLKPELARHCDFLRGIGIDVCSLEPRMWITSEDEQFADEIFKIYGFEPARTIALFAGSRVEHKIYEHYGLALREICKKSGYIVITLGAGRDYEINQRNLEAVGERGVNLSGQMTLRQTASVLKRCRLAVGADTAIAHIACVVKTPNVILLGGAHFGRFMPYSPLTTAVSLPLECYGCDWQCRYDRVYCVWDVAAEVISEAIRQSLSGPSTKPRVFVQGASLWNAAPGRPRWKAFDGLLDMNNIEIICIELNRRQAGKRQLQKV
jgi:FkbM family methyltransferase